MGNRWARMTNYFTGRSYNSIKNHFYCTLRKSLRRLNKFISSSKIQNKPISNVQLSKILAVQESKFKNPTQNASGKARELAEQIVEDLVKITRQNEDEENQNIRGILAQVTKKIKNFGQEYKKKRPKKKKKINKQEEEEPVTGTRVPNKSLLNLEYGENKTQGVAESREMTAQTDILTMKGSVQLPMLASSDFMNASMNFMNSDYHRENPLLESIDLFRLPIPQDLGLGSPAAF